MQSSSVTHSQLNTDLKLHFRVLVLDRNLATQKTLEKSFLAMFVACEKVLNYEDTIFYFVSDVRQLADAPDIAALNTVWINIDFPDWNQIAGQFYHKNPFCYQVLYGNALQLEKELLRSRPIGYVLRPGNVREVHGEIKAISELFRREEDMLVLKNRFSSYFIPFGNIVFFQSDGRKTYIYVNAAANSLLNEDDTLVKQSPYPGELLAFTQNKKLDELLQSADSSRFIRVHQSYAVNRRFVSGLKKNKQGWLLYLEKDLHEPVEIPVSGPYRNAVEKLFE